MGQCYTTYLKLRFEDEEGAKKTLQNIITRDGQVDLDDVCRHDDLDLYTIDGCLRHFYADWEHGYRWSDYPKQGWLCGDFNASYGWESVMIEVFEAIAPYLRNGSILKIYPDSDYDHLMVKDGKAIWLH